MANYYYNGVQLPAPPAEMLDAYQYIVIIRNSSDTSWTLLGCKQPLWFDPSKETPSITQNAGEVARCYFQASTGTWGAMSVGNYYYTFSYILWSNYDVPNGSKTSSNIYFYGSLPTLTAIHLINTWRSMINNGVYELSMTLDGCTPGNTLILAYTTQSANNSVRLTNGWSILGGGNNVSDVGDVYQRVFFAYKKASSNTENLVISQTEGKLMYAVCSEYANVASVLMRRDLASIGNSNYSVTTAKTNPTDIMVYAVSSAYYGSGLGQTVTPNDLTKIHGDANAERLACWFDGGLGTLSHTFRTYNGTGSRDAVLECIQLRLKQGSKCIYGNVVGHATPQPDWNQTDSSKADYIRNKPNISGGGGGGSTGILVVTTRDDAVIINSSTNVSVTGDAIIIGGA